MCFLNFCKLLISSKNKMARSYADIHKMLNLSGNAQFVSGIRETKDGKGFCLVSFSCKKYKDSQCDNDVIRYVGHGMNGDQKMWRDNKKLNDAPDNTPLWVFVRDMKSTNFRFMGIYKKYGEVYEETQDGRKVFVFPIKKCSVVVN